MTNLVIVIIDDEPKARELLKSYIQMLFPTNKFEIILCNSVDEGKKMIEAYLPDLVFLDIEMPEKDGFELFNLVKKNSFEVVFVTAYSEYLEKTVNEIGCFGYLNKPIEREKLQLIFDRIEHKIKDKKQLKFINTTQNKKTLIDLNDIMYIKAQGNCVEIYMNDKKTKYLLTKTLKEIETKLTPDYFIKVHRSYTVNLQYIDHLYNENKKLRLKHNNSNWENEIPVSSTYKTELKKRYI